MLKQLREQRAKKKAAKQTKRNLAAVDKFLAHRFLVAEPAGNNSAGYFVVNKRGMKEDITSDMADLIATTPMPWYIVGYAICKDHQRNRYIRETDAIVLDGSKSYVDSYKDFSAVLHKLVLSQTNQNHFVGAGWIASTNRAVLDPAMAYEVLTLHGIFDKYIAYWERNHAPDKLITEDQPA